MTELILRPTGVSVVDNLGAGATVVGDPATALRDSSDATYAQISARNSFGRTLDSATLPMETVPGTIDSASVADVYATMRASITGPDSTLGRRQMSVQITSQIIRFGNVYGVSGWVWPDDVTAQLDGRPDPAEVAAYGYAYTPGMAVDMMRSSWSLLIEGDVLPATTGAIITAHIYEVWVTIVYGDTEPPRLRKVPIAPLRRVPVEKWQGNVRRAGGYR